MSIALVAHAAASSLTGTGVSTGAIDTSGASLIVIATALFATSVIPGDSKSNTWTPLNSYLGSFGAVRLWYCSNPTVGHGHTFAVFGVDPNYPAIAVAAFSGVVVPGPFDVQNGHFTGDTSGQPGSITPGQNNELLITAVFARNGVPSSIDSGFTVTDLVNFSSGGLGIGMAYLVETSATAKNPTWTGTGLNATSIASFKAGASPPPPPPALTLGCASSSATQGTAYSSNLTAAGGTAPYTYAIISGALPPGLNLNPSTGAITGTPTTLGTSAYTGRVTDSLGATATAGCSITVVAAPPPPPPPSDFVIVDTQCTAGTNWGIAGPFVAPNGNLYRVSFSATQKTAQMIFSVDNGATWNDIGATKNGTTNNKILRNAQLVGTLIYVLMMQSSRTQGTNYIAVFNTAIGDWSADITGVPLNGGNPGLNLDVCPSNNPVFGVLSNGNIYLVRAGDINGNYSGGGDHTQATALTYFLYNGSSWSSGTALPGLDSTLSYACRSIIVTASDNVYLFLSGFPYTTGPVPPQVTGNGSLFYSRNFGVPVAIAAASLPYNGLVPSTYTLGAQGGMAAEFWVVGYPSYNGTTIAIPFIGGTPSPESTVAPYYVPANQLFCALMSSLDAVESVSIEQISNSDTVWSNLYFLEQVLSCVWNGADLYVCGIVPTATTPLTDGGNVPSISDVVYWKRTGGIWASSTVVYSGAPAIFPDLVAICPSGVVPVIFASGTRLGFMVFTHEPFGFNGGSVIYFAHRFGVIMLGGGGGGCTITVGAGLGRGMSILTAKQWTTIREKGLTGMPLAIYLDQEFPNAGFHLWPIPALAYVIEFYYWAVLQGFADPTTSVEFPPGYYDALVFNLAVALCASYRRPVPPAVYAMAGKALKSMQEMNAQILVGSFHESKSLSGPSLGELKPHLLGPPEPTLLPGAKTK